MSLRVRTASQEHVPEVAAIEQEAFSDPWSEAAFADVLATDHMYFAVATEVERPRDVDGGGEGAVVGYVVAWFAGGVGEIANLAVASAVRGRGVGGMLLDAALVEARREGVEEIFLEVRESNAAARRLYEERSFAEVGRRTRYYRRPTEDAIILRRQSANEV